MSEKIYNDILEKIGKTPLVRKSDLPTILPTIQGRIREITGRFKKIFRQPGNSQMSKNPVISQF